MLDLTSLIKVKMKECPKCGKRFNWWQRAIGENKEHVRNCCCSGKKDELTLAAVCRGCPAGCFEGAFEPGKKQG